MNIIQDGRDASDQVIAIVKTFNEGRPITVSPDSGGLYVDVAFLQAWVVMLRVVVEGYLESPNLDSMALLTLGRLAASMEALTSSLCAEGEQKSTEM